MGKMQIEIVKIEKIRPYANNPRINDEAVPFVAESIKQFGFKNPILIDKNNEIIAGHTRYKACCQLGIREVPCIRVEDLTEDQIKAFRIADNKVQEIAEWDKGKLTIELADIDIDMSAFDINVGDIFDADGRESGRGYYGDERERTFETYNLNIIDWANLTNDFWQMPTIENDHYVPKNLIGFNYAKTSSRKDTGVHFYLDDYQFERVWNYPEKYVDILSQYECILTPDFSLYLDMPMPMKIWNTYRSRQIGAYYQSKGIKVVPTISWAEEDTYQFCFAGIPKGSIVSISTIGVKEDATALQIWNAGMDEMIRVIEPSDILIYGGELEYDYGRIVTHYFENEVTKNWKKSNQ